MSQSQVDRRRRRVLSVICIKVVVERTGRDESAEGSGIHDEKQRTKNRAMRNTCLLFVTNLNAIRHTPMRGFLNSRSIMTTVC